MTASREPHWITTSAIVLARDVKRLGLTMFVRLLPFVITLTSCGPAWQARWENLGVDSVKCVGQNVAPAAVALLVQALSAATGAQTDWGAVGEEVGAKYGAQAGGCVLSAAINDLSTPPHGAMTSEGAKRRLHALEVAKYLWQNPQHVERGAKARSMLERHLAERDLMVVDLDAVRHHLADNYGDATTMRVVRAAWEERTPEPTSRAGDVMWLATQPSRVRDVAWLLTWSTVRKAGR